MKRANKSIRGSCALLPAIAVMLAAGCSETPPPAAAGSAVANLAVNATIGTPVAAEKPVSVPSQNGGVVKTVQTAGGYSYLQVDVGGEEFWLATMATAVQPGQSIAWRDYAPMNNFKSRALGREFEHILFVDRIFAAQAAVATEQQGVVEELLSAAGYSFIRVDQNGSSVWLAAPETNIDIGQSIKWSGGAPMRNFTSRSLDRRFDEILFVGGVYGS